MTARTNKPDGDEVSSPWRKRRWALAFNLGIDLDDARVVAAVERASSVRVVVLGRGGRAIPPAAHIATDGSVRVADEARAQAQSDREGLVDDVFAWLGDGAEHRVNGWAVTGEVLVAHVLAYVVRRSAHAGEELGRATLTAPASWPAARVAALREAAGLAGLADVDVVTTTRAVERAPAAVRDDPERAGAVGAAVLAAARKAAPAAVATQAIAAAGAAAAAGSVSAPEPVTGALDSVSVFGGAFPDAEPPARALGGRGAGGAGGSGSSPPPRGPGGSEPPGRDRLPFYIAGGVIGVLLLVLILVLVLRDDGGDDTATSSSTSSSSTTSTSSSTTSTSSTTTSTTTTSTTTTTVPGSTTTSTTTTIPRELGKALLLKGGLVLDYGTASSHTLTFGDEATDTLNLLRATLGGPDTDTGWQTDDVETCSGTQTRRVTWGDLEVVFSELEDSSSEAGFTRSFEQWFVDSPGTVPPGLVTFERVGVGSLVADLKFNFPDLEISHPRPGDDTGFFTTESGDDDLIAGFTTDTTDDSKVTQMWAGNACQRLADAD
jgi:hypothetical protein